MFEVSIGLPVISWFVNRAVTRIDKRLGEQDTDYRVTRDTLSVQSQALAVLVADSPRFEKRLSVVEERVTGIRETTAALKVAIQAHNAQLDSHQQDNTEGTAPHAV